MRIDWVFAANLKSPVLFSKTVAPDSLSKPVTFKVNPSSPLQSIGIFRSEKNIFINYSSPFSTPASSVQFLLKFRQLILLVVHKNREYPRETAPVYTEIHLSRIDLACSTSSERNFTKYKMSKTSITTLTSLVMKIVLFPKTKMMK